MIRLLLKKPGDPSSESGRSLLRYQRAALTSIVLMAGRVVNLLTGLLTVPITLNYLGEDLFSIWMVVTSVVGFLSFSDFGIGIGLRNMLIECAGKDDFETPKKLIGNALIVLLGMFFFISLFVFFVFPLLSWDQLIKCQYPDSVPHILPTMQSVVFMFALGLPVSQLQNITNAYQRGYWGYFCLFLGRVFGFLFVIWCVFAGQPLWLLAGGYIGFPFFVSLLGWGILLWKVPYLRPSLINPEIAVMKRLFGIGFFVLLYHLSYSMLNSSVIIIIANTIGTEGVVPYSVTQKLLSVSSVITMSLLAGISVAVGEAWHRKDLVWVGKSIHRTEKLTFLFGVIPLIFLLLFGRTLIYYWTKSSASIPSFPLLLVCTLFSGIMMFGNIYSNSLIAMNYVRLVALLNCLGGFILIYGGYYLGKISQSSALIVILQSFVGAFIPTIVFRWKFQEKMKFMDYLNKK